MRCRVACPNGTPRPEVRTRVLSAVTGRAVTADRAMPKRGRASIWLPLAAGVVLVAGLAGYARLLQGRVSNLRRDSTWRSGVRIRRSSRQLRPDELQRGAEPCSLFWPRPTSRAVDLAGLKPSPSASARALWSRNRGMVFTVSGLPRRTSRPRLPGLGRHRPCPVSAGLLALDQSGAATTFFQTPPDIAAPVAVAVTLEPAGGVPAPTGEMYLIGKPGRSL